MKETLTVTALRQAHKRGMSQRGLERIAGGAHHLHYLDKKYHITRPAPEPKERAFNSVEAYLEFHRDGQIDMAGR